MNDTQQTLFLVSNTKSKAEHPQAAKDLYQSPWFKKAKAYVEQSGYPWMILSDEHGLVAPEDIIEPHEQHLSKDAKNKRLVWAMGIHEKLAELCNPPANVVILAGKKYREFLVDMLQEEGYDVSVPMEGLKMGEQLSYLSEQLEDI